jgi:hypothetical protein
MVMKKLPIIILALFTMAGCVNKKGLTVHKAKTQFGIKILPAGWHEKSFIRADLYFEHEDKNASIFISSQCERVSDSPPESLLAQLLVGLGKYEIMSQNYLYIQDREALMAEVNITIDGVKRYLKGMIYKKAPCVIDAVFNAPKQSILTQDFDAMISTLWVDDK